MRLIENKHNKQIVNLDLVTYIHPAESKTGGDHKIYFVFDSMNAEDVNEIQWIFKELSDFESVIGKFKAEDF